MKLKPFSQSLIGLIIIVLGVGFLLEAIHVVDFGSLLSTWWPSLIILAGLTNFFSTRRFLWPMFIVIIGVLLQLRALSLLTFDLWGLVWPAALIIAGLSFIFERGSTRRMPPKSTEPIEGELVKEPTKKADSAGPAGSATGGDEIINAFAAFGGVNRRVSGVRIIGGDISAVFGGVELDLRGSTLANGSTIEVFAAFGGVTIRVPEGWNVRANGLPLFGGWEDKSRKPDGAGAPVLNIRGTVLFGGFEVKN